MKTKLVSAIILVLAATVLSGCGSSEESPPAANTNATQNTHQYYLAENGESVGPYTWEQLKAMDLEPERQIIRAGQQNWMQVKDFPELLATAETPAPAEAENVAQQPSAPQWTPPPEAASPENSRQDDPPVSATAPASAAPAPLAEVRDVDELRATLMGKTKQEVHELMGEPMDTTIGLREGIWRTDLFYYCKGKQFIAADGQKWELLDGNAWFKSEEQGLPWTFLEVSIGTSPEPDTVFEINAISISEEDFDKRFD